MTAMLIGLLVLMVVLIEQNEQYKKYQSCYAFENELTGRVPMRCFNK